MAFWQRIDRPVTMASRWRRRAVCEIHAEGRRLQATLHDISGRNAVVQTGEALALGMEVQLLHPEAGAIDGRVSEIGHNQMRIAFDGHEEAVAFALGAIMADMTRR